MRHIDRNTPPQSLADWKRQETVPANRRYDGRDGGSFPTAVKDDIREARVADQYYLCAYTMREIRQISWNGQQTWDAHIEHVISQECSRNRFREGDQNAFDDTIDYNNMLACVDRGSSLPYGAPARGSQKLEVHPLQANCKQRFQYKLDGKVHGLTPEAERVVIILKLNHSALVDLRRARMEAEGFAIPKPKTPGRRKILPRKTPTAAKARQRATDVMQPNLGRLIEFCVAIAHGAQQYAQLKDRESRSRGFARRT